MIDVGSRVRLTEGCLDVVEGDLAEGAQGLVVHVYPEGDYPICVQLDDFEYDEGWELLDADGLVGHIMAPFEVEEA